MLVGDVSILITGIANFWKRGKGIHYLETLEHRVEGMSGCGDRANIGCMG